LRLESKRRWVHWVMEENPSGATSALTRFLGASSSALPQMRMTPAEVAANQTGSDQIASSGLAGVSTKVLFGNPSSSGFYTIVLFVPAHTTIPAHAHRDDVPRGVTAAATRGCAHR
jgi:hypothetical protein